MRGLKLIILKIRIRHSLIVAPLAGAWIEMDKVIPVEVKKSKSHPSRVRGLKSVILVLSMSWMVSHPSRVRGLKYLMGGKVGEALMSHPSRVRGLKFFAGIGLAVGLWSHPSRVRGLK